MSFPPSSVALKSGREGFEPLNEPWKRTQRERGYGNLLNASTAILGKLEHFDAEER
jgi:hypothetical protein